jgi:hypothetical protein
MVRATKPLPTGRQAFRHSVTVTLKELRDEKTHIGYEAPAYRQAGVSSNGNGYG